MDKPELQNTYIQVQDGAAITYGGRQGMFSEKKMSAYGCGLVAIGDILLYLHRYKNAGTGDIFFSWDDEQVCRKDLYLDYLRTLEKKYFYVSTLIRGITGWALAIGFNVFAKRKKLGYRAVWGVMPHKLHSSIEKSLKNNIPVLFSVGAHFPFFWKKCGVTLYVRDGISYRKACTVCKHYMTITGIVCDGKYGEMLRISSWGREYYMRWDEYEHFMRKCSNPLYTNILLIRNSVI
ncbi:MAG: hypothetical protein ACI4GD_06015 [Lachnospiraceae bacterium]